MDKIKMTLPGKPTYLTTARMAVSSVASTAGFDVEKVEDLQVAIEEACKVIACHGQAGFSESYDIEIDVEADHLVISVSDYESAGTINKENFHFCMRCPEEGNMGLAIIETLVDSYDIEMNKNGNKKLTMVKNK